MVPLVFLILRCGPNFRKIKATSYIFLYTGGGSCVLFITLCYLYKITGHTDFSILTMTKLPVETQIHLASGFILALMVKIPLFPFHL